MSPSSKDLAVSIVLGVALAVLFATVGLAEMLFGITRDHEDSIAGEMVAGILALAIVAVWFALRRWREVAGLEEALKRRRAMEGQLREGYKVAAMGTLGGGFAGELTRAIEPVEAAAREGMERAGVGTEERSRFETITQAARGVTGVVNRMLAFGDGGVGDREVIVAAEAVRHGIELAREKFDSTLDIEYCIDDGASRIEISRWEANEVMRQLVANAVDAMGVGGRMRVIIEGTEVDEDEARRQGVRTGAHLRIRVEDEGSGIPSTLDSHVFEPFFTTKGAGDGKGLGLAIAYSLVRGWNGNLSVGRGVNSGASFEILIPVARVVSERNRT